MIFLCFWLFVLSDHLSVNFTYTEGNEEPDAHQNNIEDSEVLGLKGKYLRAKKNYKRRKYIS